MKALFFEKSGLNNLKFGNMKEPEIGAHDVLIRVKMTGVNPIDYFVVEGIPVEPLPHIPGAEIYGEIVKVGEHAKSVKPGDKVVVYNRVFDGECDFCLAGMEMLCRNGGIISVITNGGFSEYFAVPEKNVFKVNLPDEVAASLPVAALTSYHALKEANVKPTDVVVVFGASGNTGQFALQLARKMGAITIAVSRKQWVKDFADYVIDYENAENKIKDLTGGKLADVVINSVGTSVWDLSLKVLGVNGRLVFFGGLTGFEGKINISELYGKHQKLIGTTGGSRKEMAELISLCKDCKVKVSKVYNLEDGKEALASIMKNRDGRSMIKIS
ncbi:alcohol dehydrogenase [Sulfolobus acidocaldarius SUSAZ]|nr:alcohol dehydrogenase [Sulfolobus acidocaldarius SUSAZ]